MEEAQELINEIQKGLLQWYDFKDGGRVLYIGNADTPLVQMLSGKKLEVVCKAPDFISDDALLKKWSSYFDYIICISSLEKQADPTNLLRVFRILLKSDGTMLLGMNNRMGVRYFCGDKDPYTNRCFDGVEGYKRVYVRKEDVFRGRCYTMAEMKDMLVHAGWNQSCFYSVFPDLQNPSLIYSEDFLPNEDLSNRLIPFFNDPQTALMDERMLYSDLIDAGLFHQMANAYLIECVLDGSFSDINHVTCSMDRGKDKALFTIIRKSGQVEKIAAYEEGRKRLEAFIEHGRDLSEHGISVVSARMEGDAYVMPFVEGEVAQRYLKRLINTDKDKFLQEMDRFRDLILQSSDIVKEDTGDGEGALLRRGYVDLVPLNSFYIDGGFVFYDQEFYEENYPANAIITRMITTFYYGNWGIDQIIPMDEMFERYHLSEKKEHWCQMENSFLTKLLNVQSLCRYYNKHRLNESFLNSNRQRINYSDMKYREVFIDIFKNADTHKLILFGSGRYATRFLEMYQNDYPVYAIVDNNNDRWGEELNGIEIQSPEILKQFPGDECKVIICIKNFVSVIDQLERMGITKYSIYDSNMGYESKRREYILQNVEKKEETTAKKYHVGYVSGVFDLFHVGHLNMFKRAKEQCDYLIVGVVTDEGVRKYKNVEPFVPFEERIEMVRACRYVDEAVKIPLHCNDTKDAYRLYHFDCQFSGSDYMNDPFWLSNKEFLEQNGSEMVFFPYTESTNSSKIKALIEKRIM